MGQSAFPFERTNGCLLKFVNGTQDVLDQITTKYMMWKKSEQKDFENTIGTQLIGKATKLRINRREEFVSVENDECLNFHENSTVSVFSRLNKNGIIYTSLLYKKLKTIDYFVHLRGGEIGMVKYYAMINDRPFLFIDEYVNVDTIDHISEVELSGLQLCAPVEYIVHKHLYMCIDKKHYISMLPNMYEKE